MAQVDDAIEDAGLHAFARLLRAGSFSELLKGATPFTIFAPTDDAFTRFPHDVDRVIANDAMLRALVGYHFAPGKVMAKRFAGARIRAVTFGGQSLIIDGRSGVRINAANLVTPDIVVGASVIHAIDEVLRPLEPVAAKR